MKTKISKTVGLSLVLLAVMALLTHTPALAYPQPPPGSQPVITARPAAATVNVELCAVAGSVTMPDGENVPIWGFAPGGGSTCPSSPQLPGPTLRVNAGDTVNVTLINTLTVATSIIFPGQTGVTASGGGSGLFTAEASPGGSVSYSFTASEPGTYLYESGTADQPQTAMGLYGALIVDSITPGQAYSDGSTAYDVEEVLVLSEIDPALNANPGGFNLLDYNPTYWLINGQAYPDTAAISSAPGQRVLVRYVNAGGNHHTMTLLGQYQRIIARNADELTGGQAYDATAETIPSGQTADAIMVFNAEGSYPLYNRQLHLTNGSDPNDAAYFSPGGGMMTFVMVTGSSVNLPPTVDAGINQTITLPASASLDGTVTDSDGPGPLTTNWTMDSGPGSVTFGNASSVDTTASFSVAGIYVLRLTANDGADTASDTVTITVNTATNKHIGDLDQVGTNLPFGPTTWTATAFIIVHNASHSPISGATVTGTWSSGGASSSCTTTTTIFGTFCSVSRVTSETLGSNTFTVTGVTGAGGAGPYTASLNHDPDTGAQSSDGTSIVVPNP